MNHHAHDRDQRNDQWKFWKKPQTLADLAMDLAKNETSDSQ
jgi:hypothetical protein